MQESLYLPALNSALCILVIFVCFSVFLTRGLGVYAARATGESMLPAIPKDALIILCTREPRIGDVVHVKNSAYNYVHRLVAIDGDWVLTKGDNCDQLEVASMNDVRGVVMLHAPFRLFLFLALGVIDVEAALAVLWAGKALREVRRRTLLKIGLWK